MGSQACNVAAMWLQPNFNPSPNPNPKPNPKPKPNPPGWDEAELPWEEGTRQSWVRQGPTRRRSFKSRDVCRTEQTQAASAPRAGWAALEKAQ